MMLKTIFALVVASSVANVIGVNGSTISVTKPELETTIYEVESKLTTLQVPDEILDMQAFLRQIQSPDLGTNDQINFITLVRELKKNNHSVEQSLSKILGADQRDNLDDVCSLYLDQLVSIIRGSSLGDELLEQIESNYVGSVKGHSRLDRMIEYGDVCAAALGF